MCVSDIPLLPSISSLNGSDEEEPGGPFTVHWLNNKELQFTLAMEVLLQMLRTAQDNPTGASTADNTSGTTHTHTHTQRTRQSTIDGLLWFKLHTSTSPLLLTPFWCH